MERKRRTFTYHPKSLIGAPVNDISRSSTGTNVGLLAIGGLVLAALILLVVLYTTTNHIIDTSVRLFKLEVTDETILHNIIQINGTTTCSQPVDNSCLPAITTFNDIEINNLNLTGTTTCMNPTDLNCIPTIPSAKLQCDSVLPVGCLGSGMGIDNSMCTTPVQLSCIPLIPSTKIQDGAITEQKLASNAVSTVKIQDGAVTNDKLSTGTITSDKLACTGPLANGCIPLISDTQLAGGITSAKLACDAALASSCVSIDSKTCTSPVDISCVPAVPTSQLLGTISNAQLAGGITSDKLSCSSELGSNCIPQNLTFDNVVIKNLTAIDFIHTNMMELNETMITVNMLDVQTVTLSNTMTCNPPAKIDIGCMPPIPATSITGTIVTSQIAAGAVDDSKISGVASTKISGLIPTTQLSGTITNAQLAGGITSAKLACDLPLAAACTQIDSETCTLPVGLSCIPTIPTTQLSGTITNAQIAAGAVDDSKISGVASTKISGLIPTTQLSGTITNAQLAGGITSAKLACDIPLAAGCVPASGAAKFASEFTWGFQALPLTANIWPGTWGTFDGSAVGSCPITIPTTGTYIIEYEANQIWTTAPPEGDPVNFDAYDIVVLFIGIFDGFLVTPIAGTEHLPIYASQFVKTPLPFPVVPIKSWEGMIPHAKSKSGSRILSLTAGTNLCLGLAFGSPDISGFGIFSKNTKLRVTEL